MQPSTNGRRIAMFCRACQTPMPPDRHRGPWQTCSPACAASMAILRKEALTSAQKDILAFVRETGLSGVRLTKALMAKRRCRYSTAANHIQRIIEKGYLTVDHQPMPVVKILRKVIAFLDVIQVNTADRATVRELQREIVEVLGAKETGLVSQ